MHLPVIRGLIDRRILVNFRIDPEVAAGVLPAPFRPQLIGPWAIGGICLIRLRAIRPAWAPAWLGVGSENAAHRLAVEWDEAGERRQGVYIPRRDTSSWLNTLAGGRVFPGTHHHARFDVDERDERYRLRVASDDGSMQVSIDADRDEQLRESSAFGSLAAASRFFQRGSLGYSPAATAHDGCQWFEGLELTTTDWNVRPLAIRQVHSSFFEDAARFPPGSAELDSALLMRHIEHRWHQRPPLRQDSAAPSTSLRPPLSRAGVVVSNWVFWPRRRAADASSPGPGGGVVPIARSIRPRARLRRRPGGFDFPFRRPKLDRIGVAVTTRGVSVSLTRRHAPPAAANAARRASPVTHDRKGGNHETFGKSSLAAGVVRRAES